MKMLRALVLVLLVIWGLPAQAGKPALGQGVTLSTRDPQANQVLNRVLQPSFWEGADRSDYTKYLYDGIWLKWYEASNDRAGYMTLITGEGDQSFKHDVVADIIIDKQDLIDDMVDGAEAVEVLGRGTDSRNGLSYVDAFYFLDMGAFYATYAQRMYRLEAGERTILFFEKLDASFMDAATWASYQRKIEAASNRVSRRSVLGSVVPVEQIFGMFIVSPGSERETRVTFIAKIAFSEDNWVANLGSKMPPVLRAGLASGFNACVQIAAEEQKRRGL